MLCLMAWAGTLVFSCPQTGTCTINSLVSLAFGFRLELQDQLSLQIADCGFVSLYLIIYKCPWTDEWVKKMWYIYRIECYSAIKRNEIGSFAEM